MYLKLDFFYHLLISHIGYLLDLNPKTSTCNLESPNLPNHQHGQSYHQLPNAISDWYLKSGSGFGRRRKKIPINN